MSCRRFGCVVEFDHCNLHLILLGLLWYFANLWKFTGNTRLVQSFSDRVSEHDFVDFGLKLTHFCEFYRDFSITTTFLLFFIRLCWRLLWLVFQFVNCLIIKFWEWIIGLVDITTKCHGRSLIFLIAVHVIVVILILICYLIRWLCEYILRWIAK